VVRVPEARLGGSVAYCGTGVCRGRRTIEPEDQPTPEDNAEAVETQAVLRFVAQFVALVVLFYVVTDAPWYEDGLLPVVMTQQAAASAWILQWLDVAVQTDGVHLRGDGLALEIAEGCDAFESMALHASACLAYSAPWLHKARAIVVGGVILFVVNILRIAALFAVGLWANDWFHVAHTEIMPGVIILVAFLLFFDWVRRQEDFYAAEEAAA
jgi:exosortase/archaeosortase family protein